MDYLTPVSSQGDLPVRPLHRAHNGELAALWRIYGGEPFHLLRTREGRDLSRARYQRAKEFQRSLEPGAPGEWTDFLYCTGIVVQLALSCHLLDVGFPDAWCARHIGLHVDRSLAYANAKSVAEGLEACYTLSGCNGQSPGADMAMECLGCLFFLGAWGCSGWSSR